jgi:two-component system OmpR family response regulator
LRRHAQHVRVGICVDERRLRSILARALGAERFEVQAAATGADALEVFLRFVPDLVIVDLRLGDLDAHKLCRSLRDRGVAAPALFLAQREALSEQLVGLDTTGDDFVVAPFSLVEILIRIRSLALRHELVPTPTGGLRLSANRHSVHVGDRVAPLTPTEFRMLEALLARRGSVIRRADLVLATWPGGSVVTPNLVDTYVARVRRKLRLVGASEVIETARGVGYALH